MKLLELSSIAAARHHRTGVFISPIAAVVVTVTLKLLAYALLVVALELTLPTTKQVQFCLGKDK